MATTKGREHPMPTMYEGSCPCGAVRFAAELDLAAGPSRCGCPLCRKTGAWAAPASHFALLRGEDVLHAVRPSPCRVRIRCARCGVDPFSLGEEEPEETVWVNLRCLDEVELPAG